MKATIVFFFLCVAYVSAQNYSLTLDTKDDFLKNTTLYNCDVEKVPGRVVIRGFHAPTSNTAVLYYSFDEPDGEFKDHSTNGNDPDIYEKTEYYEFGKYGGCLNLNTSQKPLLSTPTSASLQSLQTSGDFTINFWIKLKKKFSETGTYINVFTFDDGIGLFGYESGGLELRYQNYTKDSFSRLFITGSGTLDDNSSWHNVWIVRSGNDNALYIDGTLVKSSSAGLPAESFIEPLLFGYWSGAGVPSPDGYIDDFYLAATNQTNFSSEPGVITTKTIDTDGRTVDFATVSIPSMRIDSNKGNVSYALSSDGGSNWVVASNGVRTALPTTGQTAYDKLVAKVTVTSYDKYVTGVGIADTFYSPEIDRLTLAYDMPTATLEDASYVATGATTIVRLSFPYAVDTGSPGAHYLVKDGVTNALTLSGYSPASDEKSVVISFSPAALLESGSYDLYITGYDYRDYARSITSTFRDLLIIDKNDVLDESRVVFLPNVLNTRVAGSVSTLTFTSDNEIAIDVDIYDAYGMRVRTVVRDYRGKGIIQIPWDGKDDAGSIVPSGFYYARLHYGGATRAIKLYVLQ